MVTYTRRPIFRRGSSSVSANYWRGSQSSQSIPEDAILTELGIPIVTEGDQYMLTEA